MDRIYLDNAAATPVDDAVLTAMMPYFSDQYFNPSALYSEAVSVKNALEDARGIVAQTLGAKSSEIIFTAGGTESVNLAIRGVMETYPDAEVIYSAVEHDAVRKATKGFKAVACPVDGTGRVNVDEIESKISDSTVLVSVMYANNEIGTIQPVSEIVARVELIRKDRVKRNIQLPLYIHTDACQAPNYLDCNVARLGVDLMTLNGGKIYGPKQSGVLYRRTGVNLEPQVYGGGQEFGLRSGTENVAYAVGFARALEKVVQNRASEANKMTVLSKKFIQDVEEYCGAVLNGSTKHRLPNNVHVTFNGADNERVLFSLDDQGVMAASGSACSASNEEVSHVLRAIGMTDEVARSSVRFTLGKYTTAEELAKVIELLHVALRA
jgi:cysteine desulfurase